MTGAPVDPIRRFSVADLRAGRVPGALVARVGFHTPDIMERLALRDGNQCFFCEKDPEECGPLTKEHFLARTHGGTDNINNLILACRDCNTEAAALPVTEKMRLRDRKRQERLSVSHGDPDLHAHSLMASLKPFINCRIRFPVRMGQGDYPRSSYFVSRVTAWFLREVLFRGIEEVWAIDGGMPNPPGGSEIGGRGQGGFRPFIQSPWRPHWWVVGWRSRTIVDLSADQFDHEAKLVVTDISDPRYRGNLTEKAIADGVGSDLASIPFDPGTWMGEWEAKQASTPACRPEPAKGPEGP